MRLGKSKISIAVMVLFLSSPVLAENPLPASEAIKSIGSIQPGVVGSQLQSQMPTQPSAVTSAITSPAEKAANPLGEEASKIKFKLTKIILEGNKVYSTQELSLIYQDKLNKTITVAQLQDIVQNITNYYRNNGYILSRAIIPPQHVANGVVRIRVLEGYIDKATVIGTPRGARDLVQAYGDNIVKVKPAQIKVMEHYLLIANEIPGVQVKAVLEPSKSQTAASDLNLATDIKNFSGFISYDDYGTRYIGPQQITAGAAANSIFRSGDTTRLTYVTTPKGNELQYRDAYHETPLGGKGLRLGIDVNQALTNPLFVLAPFKIAGDATTYTGTLTYPLIRTRSSTLTLNGIFNYLDSYTTELDEQLYTDHVRAFRFGAEYDFADSHRGTNTLEADVSQGFEFLGGTSNSQSFYTSRYGATSKFTKLDAQASRLQALFWRLSAYGIVKGQYCIDPLLASEQFGFGGSQIGRGYDPAEIIGDRGLAGSLELRLDTAPEKFYIQTIQFYAFYDAGKIWNLRNVQSISTSQSAMSTGAGARFYMTKYLSGNLLIAQPLTRQVQSLELIGNGSQPRVLFSIVAVV